MRAKITISSMISLLILLNFVDYGLTVYAVGNGAVEGNVLMRALIENGYHVYTFIKVFIASLIFFAASRYIKKKEII